MGGALTVVSSFYIIQGSSGNTCNNSLMAQSDSYRQTRATNNPCLNTPGMLPAGDLARRTRLVNPDDSPQAHAVRSASHLLLAMWFWPKCGGASKRSSR